MYLVLLVLLGSRLSLTCSYFGHAHFIDFENSKYSIANRRMFKVEKFLNNLDISHSC